jgi:dihydroflavonol-4-reductase
MQPDPTFWSGKRVCVTGGTGFLGWHLVQQLAPIAGQVRILGFRPASPKLSAQLQDHDCIFGDVRDPVAVRDALRDCDIVFHTAGTVVMSGAASLRKMQEIHLAGTQQVLRALPAQARLVHTSTVCAIGASRDGTVQTESSPFNLQHLKVDYVHAKRAAEELARSAARQGSDVVVVNPGYLIGPEDYEGSVMGRFCLRCWKGKVSLIPPGALNFVDVRDVARGHLLAAEYGRAGQRYILGGDNLPLVEFVHQLAAVRGIPSRWWFRMPGWFYTLLAYGAELRGRLLRREPYPSIQHVRLNRYDWYYSSERARDELGYERRPLLETLIDMHAWYCRHGYLKESGQQTTEIQSHRRTLEPHRDEVHA